LGREPLDIQIASPEFGKIDVAHGLQRHSNQQLQIPAVRPDECMDSHVARDVVSRRAVRVRRQQKRGQHD
jgi:hypothetical protein